MSSKAKLICLWMEKDIQERHHVWRRANHTRTDAPVDELATHPHRILMSSLRPPSSSLPILLPNPVSTS